MFLEFLHCFFFLHLDEIEHAELVQPHATEED